MADVIAMVTELAKTTTAITNELSKRSDLNNTPEMQKALVIHRLQDWLDEQRKEIADEDLEACRLLIADPDSGAGA